MTQKTNIAPGARLSLAAAAAGVSAAIVLLFSAGDAAHASPMAAPKLSAKAVAFRSAMDKLWEDTSSGRGW
jgi:hypothetical protein